MNICHSNIVTRDLLKCAHTETMENASLILEEDGKNDSDVFRYSI